MVPSFFVSLTCAASGSATTRVSVNDAIFTALSTSQFGCFSQLRYESRTGFTVLEFWPIMSRARVPVLLAAALLASPIFFGNPASSVRQNVLLRSLPLQFEQDRNSSGRYLTSGRDYS